jgi:hypothetical protein
MTTSVVLTNYTQEIQFSFNQDGTVNAVVNQIRTLVQDPDTMELIAAHTDRTPLSLDDAKVIIANSQMGN